MTELLLRNAEPVEAGQMTNLGLRLTAPGAGPVFLKIPLGDGAEALVHNVDALYGCTLSAGGELTEGERFEESGGRIGVVSLISRQGGGGDLVFERLPISRQTGTARLWVEDQSKTVLAACEIDKVKVPAKVTAIGADRYAVTEGETVRVSWTVEPEDTPVRVTVKPEQAAPAEMPRPGAREIEVAPVHPDATVEVSVRDGTDAPRICTILSANKTEVRTEAFPTDDVERPGILSLHSGGDRLYAVVATGATSAEAMLFVSQDGWRDWQPVRAGSGEPVTLPADTAARPAAMTPGKLWFVGGDAVDPNGEGRGVAIFDLEARMLVEPSDVAWPADMPDRMGHCVVAAPDGTALWVLGGYNGGGALADVWRLDLETRIWKQRADLPDDPRCLFGAAFHQGDLWIAGGAEVPSGRGFTDIRRLPTEAGNAGWTRLGPTLFPTGECGGSTGAYVGATLAAVPPRSMPGRTGEPAFPGALYSFAVSLGAQVYSTHVQRLRGESAVPLPNVGGDWFASGSLLEVDWARLDATTFADRVYIWRRTPGGAPDSSIHFLISV